VEVTKGAVEDAIRGIDQAGVASARWFGGKGRAIGSIELAEAFVLPGDGRRVLAVANVVYQRGPAEAYLFPLVADAGALRQAAEGDGTLRALAGAIAEGRTIAALPSTPEPAGEVTAALVCRPASALRGLEPGGAQALGSLPERPLGMDQSNTSVVLGERLLLKAFRWLQPGLNPDLELVAYLTEEAGFTAVPPLAGYAEVVSRSSEPATVALLQAFVADAADAYESTAETLTKWLLAPGSVTVEYATEIAAEIGALSAGLHAALAAAHGIPGFEPRPATRDELRRWREDARTQLDRALEITPGEAGRDLRELAPRIAEELTIFEALPTEPPVTRVHGDYHLGQVLAAPDGFRIVDFEGEPTRGLEERRAHRSPLRDVASMLRSFDHVGRSAGRRAEERNGGPVQNPGLDLEGWLRRSRERFLEAYRAGLREAGAPIEIDPALLRAFEIEKECYEFVYAATYLPEWLWAPTEGMRSLMASS
jgi:maltose alpha-D-glucosyltransferase / alpha-amylase